MITTSVTLTEIKNGNDGKTSYTHQAYSWSSDGTDRFTTVYPNENLIVGSNVERKFTPSTSGFNYQVLYEYLKMETTYSLQGKLRDIIGDVKTVSVVGHTLGQNGQPNISEFSLPVAVDSSGNFKVTFTTKQQPFLKLLLYAGVAGSTVGIGFTLYEYKLELGNKSTIHTTNPQDDFVNAWPSYTGTYTSFDKVQSLNPSDYTWARMLGVGGKDGEPGQPGKDGDKGNDGVGIKSTVITYAASASGISAPTAGWQANPPSVAENNYLWTRTFVTYTNNTTTTSYSVGKMGAQGPQGIQGVAYLQPTQPDTTQENAQWFKTVSTTDLSVTDIYVYKSSKWNKTPIAAGALNIASLSAISANLGTVTAGILKAVTIEGSEFNTSYTNAPLNPNDTSGTTVTVTGTSSLKGGALQHKGTIAGTNPFSTYYGAASISMSAQKANGDLYRSFYLGPEGLDMRENTTSGGTIGGFLTGQDAYVIAPTILTNTTSNFTPYATSIGSTSTPTATRKLRSVQLSGAFKNIASFSGKAIMATLPIGFRPSAIVSGLCQGSGSSYHYIEVNPDGSISTERYSTGNVPVGAWLKIDISFIAADIS